MTRESSTGPEVGNPHANKGGSPGHPPSHLFSNRTDPPTLMGGRYPAYPSPSRPGQTPPYQIREGCRAECPSEPRCKIVTIHACNNAQFPFVRRGVSGIPPHRFFSGEGIPPPTYGKGEGVPPCCVGKCGFRPLPARAILRKMPT
jgi:hypothetical protein